MNVFIIEDHKNYIYEKIVPTLPQDITGGLIFDGLIDKNEEIKIIENKYNER